MKKKILFIIWSYSYGGGAEKVLSQIVNNLNEKKYDISILEFYHTNIKKEKTNDNITILPPIIDANNTNGFLRKIYNLSIYFFPFLLRKKIPNDYDVEIAFNYQIPTFLLHKDKKSICWVHGAPLDLKSSVLKRYLQRNAYYRTNAIVPIAKLTENTLNEVFPEYKNKMYPIYNGYDFDLMNIQSKKTIDIEIENNSITFCGRLTDGKNPLELLQVVKKIHEKGIEVHLYLLGDGNLKESIIKRSKDYEIEKYVHLLGYIENPYPIISKSKLIVMLSKGEGFPTVFVEGMYFGKPFVSTYVGGCEELSQNGKNGFIIENIDDCANKIYDLLTNKNLYLEMSNSCKEYIDRFSISNQINEIEKLIDKVLEEEE